MSGRGAAAPTIPGPDPAPRAPGFAVPAEACDCHAHIFAGPDHPSLVADRVYTPPACPLPAYRHMLSTLGVERCVLVQPSVYGTDNGVMLEALDALGDRGRGIAVVRPDVDAGGLAALHARGVRGLRLNLLYRGGGVGLDDAAALVRRIAPLGWHLQFLVDVSADADLCGRLARLPVPCVVDHLGHVPAARGAADPGFQALVREVGAGRLWVKLSGAYRVTAQAAPPYADVAPMAAALVAANPERLVWATDWPHPALRVPVPNDGALLGLLAAWVPDAALRRCILVENPARLYGFP